MRCVPATCACSFFQVPRKLLERLAAERLGAAGEEDELAGFEEDDSELVFDDVGPEASALGPRDAFATARPSITCLLWIRLCYLENCPQRCYGCMWRLTRIGCLSMGTMLSCRID